MMVFLVEIVMLCLRDKRKSSHLDLPLELCFTLMKASKYALLLVNCLVLQSDSMMDTQLGLMKKLILFFPGSFNSSKEGIPKFSFIGDSLGSDY